ncbi:MAG: hypothetical protein HKN46_00390, partial [Acidimicrobiia bacterium]|nr:hypothetical protein [Acidimicrobiia bacterium]
IAYGLAVRFGLLFISDDVSLFWPASGIALGTLAATPRDRWRGVVAGLVLGFIAGVWGVGEETVPQKLGFLVVNLIEVLPAAYFLRTKFDAGRGYDTLRGVFWFVAIGVVAGPLVASLLAATTYALSLGTAFSPTIWASWWMSDATSILIAAPATMALFYPKEGVAELGRSARSVASEFALIVLASLGVLAGLLVPGVPTEGRALAMASAVVVLVWAAGRTPVLWNAWLSALLLSGVAIGVALDLGPFPEMAVGSREAVFLMHTFVLALGLIGLVFGAAILDARRSELKAKALLVEAQAANDAKTRFLSSVSHELRTPLNLIGGFGELLAGDGVDGPERVEFARHVTEASGELLVIFEGLLDFAAMEQRGVSIRLQPTDLGEVVGGALATARSMPGASLVTLSDNPSGDDGPWVLADPPRVRQVVLNLLSNAVKYNRPGGQVSVTCESLADSARVTVTDTGRGVPQAQEHLLFTPFERLGVEDSTIPGTGVGLSVVQELVAAMGGEVGYSSDEGVGSSFWFSLPLVDQDR